jgi:hypothetical protein
MSATTADGSTAILVILAMRRPHRSEDGHRLPEPEIDEVIS